MMREVKVSELQGAALDLAVAMAEGYKWMIEFGAYGSRSRVVAELPDPSVDREMVYRPSIDWSQGGPLIEANKIAVHYDFEDGEWIATVLNLEEWMDGKTPLIAACRAIVASKLGDVVQIPDELVI